jgi:hypothetical protein
LFAERHKHRRRDAGNLHEFVCNIELSSLGIEFSLSAL